MRRIRDHRHRVGYPSRIPDMGPEMLEKAAP
jgi:hypothetical protein